MKAKLDEMSDDLNISSLDAMDGRLIALLREDARQPVASLARALRLSRASVYARIQRLQRKGVISGFTVRINPHYNRHLIRAHVMIKVAPKKAPVVEAKLVELAEVTALHAISGIFDMVAVVEAEGVGALNTLIDRIGAIDGVEDTSSSILLATKLLR